MSSPALRDRHEALGAVFTVSAGATVVARYRDPAEEYAAVKRGCGLLDVSARGRLAVHGDDGPNLLNRIVTNAVDSLAPGTGRAAVMVTPKGRIVDYVLVLRRPHHLLLVTSPGLASIIAATIDKYTIREAVSLEDLTPKTTALLVHGPTAAEVYAASGVGPLSSCGALSHQELDIAGGPTLFVALPGALAPGFLAVTPCARASALFDFLLESGRSYGLVPIGSDTFEILRIEAGMPAAPHELSAKYNPLEAGLRDAVSFRKGCYVGQEVIARLATYQKVQRRLAGFALAAGATLGSSESGGSSRTGGEPDHGLARMWFGSREVGHVTSAAFSPGLGRCIGLAYIRRDAFSPGRRVIIKQSDREVEGSLCELPFDAGHPPET
ncbi:MAG: aminomethyltransferase family protein [Planctomycetota bacterium]